MKLHLVHIASDATLAVVGFLFNLSSIDNPALTPLLNAAAYDSVINSKFCLFFCLFIYLFRLM